MMRRTKQRTEQDFAGYGTGSSSSSYTSDSSYSDSDDSRPEEEEENKMFRESAVVSRSGKSKKTHSSGKQRHRQNNTSERVPARTCTVQCSSKLGSKHMYNEDTYLATFDIASATKRADATDSMYLPSKNKTTLYVLTIITTFLLRKIYRCGSICSVRWSWRRKMQQISKR